MTKEFSTITFKIPGGQSVALKAQRLLAQIGAYEIHVKTGHGAGTIQSIQMNPSKSMVSPEIPSVKRPRTPFFNSEAA